MPPPLLELLELELLLELLLLPPLLLLELLLEPPLKVAVTDRLVVMPRTQVEPVQAPLQPPNVEPEAGVALRETVVPLA